LKLLLDANISPRLARSLQALFVGIHEIVPLRDKFSPSVPDLTWMKSLDEEGGWAVLTKDLHIRTRPHERAVLDSSRIVFFFLGGQWNKYTVEETAARLIRWIPKIAAHMEGNDRGRFELPINAGSALRRHRD
jgi:PIN like domain